VHFLGLHSTFLIAADEPREVGGATAASQELHDKRVARR
jgi:hypothetical protein